MKKSITTLLLLVLCLLLCGTALAEDTPSVFHVLETNTFRATFGNLVFDGEDSCTYDVMIANLTDEVMELESPEAVTLNPGESFLFIEYSWPIMNTDQYGLSGILFELYGFTESDEVFGSYFLYYDRDTNKVLRTETEGGESAALVFEHSNELVSMEVYYNFTDADFNDVNTSLVVTNISSYALYDWNGEIIEPGQRKSFFCLGRINDEDTVAAYIDFRAYNASKKPVLSMAFEVLLNRKNLSVISSTEHENFIDPEQAKNTDVYRVNKVERVNAEVVSTPYYTLTVKEIRAEEQPDGTIRVTLTAEMTNNTGSFYMLGADAWKMGDEIKYAAGYPGYFGPERPVKVECTYTVSSESDLSGTAAFAVEGGWDPGSGATLFGAAEHTVTVHWAGGKPSLN